MFESLLNKGIPSGYTPLDAFNKVPKIHLYPYENEYIVGGYFNPINNDLILINGTGGTITVTGFTTENIYNSDGTLTDNRVVNLDGKTLSIKRSPNLNDPFLTFLDDSGKIMFEIRSQNTNFDPTQDDRNIFIGRDSGALNTTGRFNVAFGDGALSGNTTGTSNTAIGWRAGRDHVDGLWNTFIGMNAGVRWQTGNDNTVVGQNNANTRTTGTENTFIGNEVNNGNYVVPILSGNGNTIVGAYTARLMQSDNNVIIGRRAGVNLTTGSRNVFIGRNSGNFVTTDSDLLHIDNVSTTTPLIWGDFANDLLRFNGKVGVNVQPSTYQFDVNGTSRFSNTVQLDTVNSGNTDTKVLTLSSGNVVQYRDISDTLFSFSGGTYLTGGTLLPGEIVFTDNNGETFSVTGFTKYFISGSSPTGYVLVNGDRWYNTNNGVEYVWIDDGNSSQWVEPASSGGGGESVGNYLSLIGLTANTIDVNQIGVSGDCVNDLYVTNIHSCSPLNINPLDEGNVYFGSTSGVTINLNGTPKVSIDTNSLDANLNIHNKIITVGSEIFTNPDLTSNSSGWTLGPCVTWYPGSLLFLATSGCGFCNSYASTNISTVSGKYYLLSFEISGATDAMYLYFINNDIPESDKAKAWSNGKHNLVFRSNYTGSDEITFDAFACYEKGFGYTLYNLSLKECNLPEYLVDGRSHDGNNLLKIGGFGDNLYIGLESGINSTGNTGTINIGDNSGANTKDIDFSIYLGSTAGMNSSGDDSVFIGFQTGIFGQHSDSVVMGGASGAYTKGGKSNVLIGDGASFFSKSLEFNNFIGKNVGSVSTGVTYSNYAGYWAGHASTNVGDSNFFGQFAGGATFNIKKSNFFGSFAGYRTELIENSNFIGERAGYESGNIKDSLFIGRDAGRSFSGGSNNIIIGTSVTLPNFVNNSINIGNVLYGINTQPYNNLVIPTSLPTTQGKIGIGVVTPLNRLHVEDTSNPLRLVGLQSNSSDTRILTSDSNGVIRYRNFSDFSGGTTVTITGNYLPLSGGTVTGDVTFQSGITANIISGGTLYGNGGNLTNVVTSVNVGVGLSGNSTNGNITLINTSPDQTVILGNGTGISTSGTYPNFTITNTAPDQTVTITGGTGISTGGSYPNFTITNSAPDQTVVLGNGTGISISGTYPNFTITNTAPNQSVTITGGTNIEITGTYPNFGVKYNGQTEFPYLTLSGGTVTGDVTFQSGITSNTLSVNQIGVSGDCVNDLYVSNIHSCSPLNINPLNEGDVIFGSSTSGSGITIRLSEGRSSIGIGTKSPTSQLHIVGSENPVRIEGLPSGETKNKIITINEDGVLASSTLPEFAATLPVSFKLGFNGIINYDVFGGTGIQNFGLLDRGMFVAFDLDTALKLPHTATTTDYIYSFRVTTHEQFGGVQNNVGVRTVLASSAGEFPFNTIAPAVFLPQTTTDYALQYSDVVVAVPKIVLGQPVYYVKFEIIMERFASGRTSVIGANLRFN